MKGIHRNIVAAALYFFAAVTIAQTSNETAEGELTEAEELDYYQVELVIFRHLDQSVTTPEIRRPLAPEMTELLEQDLARLGSNNPAPASEAQLDGLTSMDGEVAEEIWFDVDDREHLLDGTVRRMENLRAYELLGYLSWGQTAPDVTIAEPIDLTDIAGPGLPFSGSVELHQRRYLHLALDVALGNSAQPTAASDSVTNYQFIGDVSAPPAIKDSRRIRLEKLVYFDQPDFGVLAVVSRLEMPEAG